jgi:hypothetical protein
MKGAAEAELHQFFPILVIIEVNECYWLRYDPLYLLRSLRAMLRPFYGKRFETPSCMEEEKMAHCHSCVLFID